jgi:molecular chaperone DnaJ
MSNYYLALGIDKNADPDKIKKAYRFYCKQYHPDVSTEEDRKKFLIVQEAYETLSDTEKRKDYDKSLEKGCVPVNFVKKDFWNKKQSMGRRIKRFSSLLDDFFSSFVSGFFEEGFSNSKDLFLELILNITEAKKGGDFPVEIPVLEKCDKCNGRGYVNAFICTSCTGSGRIMSKREIVIHVPSGVSSGMEAKISLESIGLKNVYLHIDLTVE